jgi:hypothetical protein
VIRHGDVSVLGGWRSVLGSVGEQRGSGGQDADRDHDRDAEQRVAGGGVLEGDAEPDDGNGDPDVAAEEERGKGLGEPSLTLFMTNG